MTLRIPEPLSRFCRRGQGKALASSVYAAVMLASIGGLWAMGAHEYQTRLERMEHESADVASGIELLVATSVDHVDMLRHQAEALQRDLEKSGTVH